MTIKVEEIIQMLAEKLRDNAEFRRGKAVEHPDDDERNRQAAEMCDELAVELEGGIYSVETAQRYLACHVNEATTYGASEAETNLINRIGFRTSFVNADDLLNSIVDDAERSAEADQGVDFIESGGSHHAAFTAYDVSTAVTLTDLLKVHAARGDILSVPMPNGKTLGDSTFKEVGEIGAWLTAVGEHMGRTEEKA